MSTLSKACRFQGRWFSVQRRGALVRSRLGAPRHLVAFSHHGRSLLVGDDIFRFFSSAEFSTRSHFDDDPDTKASTAKGDNSRSTAGVPLAKNPADVPKPSQALSDAMDTKRFPLGELPVEDFLQLEDSLNKYITTNLPASRQRIVESLILYRRLVEECETNPQLLEEYEMTHWVDGNYPRSVQLLDDILGQWYKWWTENSHKEKDYSPENMLEIVDDIRSGNLSVPITDRTYTTLIRAATKAGDPAQAPIFADRLLDRMLEESLDHPMIRPSTNTLNAVLHAWAKSGLPEAPEKVESLFRVLCEQYETGVLHSPPDNSSFMALMLVWSRSGRNDAPSKVEEVLDRMKKAPWECIEPDTAAYRLAIHSWVNSKDNASSLKVYSLFVEIVRNYMASRNESVMIDGDLFSVVVSKLAKDRHCHKAEEIFQLLKELYELTDDNRFQPTLRTLLGMVIAYSHSKKTGAAEKAESMLRQVESYAWSKGKDNKLDPSLLPKRAYYVDVIKALCNSGKPDGAERAEQLLLSMIDHHRAGGFNILPDRFLCDSVLTSWARTNRPDAAQRAEDFLKLMHDVSFEFKSASAKPNEYSYLQVINAWSRSQETAAPKRAEEVFCRMLEQYNAGEDSMAPCIRHYTALISCWARSNQPDGPARAQSIFDATVELFEAGDNSFKPDRALYTSLMRAWSRVGEAHKVEAIFLSLYEEFASRRQKKSVAPNTMMFNIMLEAWLRSESPGAQHKATFLFDSMVQFSEEKTLNDVEPDGFTYAYMIEIMAKDQSKDSAEQAEKYFQLLKAAPILTDRRGHEKIFSCYVSTLAAWYGRSDAKAMKRKEALIDELVRLVQTGKIPMPSLSEYGRFLRTVAKSRIPGKSDRAVAALSIPREKLRVTRDLL